MNTLNTFVKNLLFSALLLAPTLAHATDNTCSPSIDIKPAHGITAPKEGHNKSLSSVTAFLELDQRCEHDITVRVLVLEESAKIGEHIQGIESSVYVIPKGETYALINVGIIGDNEWNEDRSFSIRAINPSHGYIHTSGVTYTIVNDDALAIINIASSTKEPRKNSVNIPIDIELSMETEQTVTGEIYFIDGSAINGKDYKTLTTVPFKIEKGSKTYSFPVNTLLILSDKLKEGTEDFFIQIKNLKNASTLKSQELFRITESTVTYSVNIKSILKAYSEGQVASHSDYSVNLTLERDENSDDNIFISTPTSPVYKHSLTNSPFQAKIHAGLIRATAKFSEDEETLTQFVLEFVDAPYEQYPFTDQKMYLYMSSFGELHRSEFVTLTDPQFSDYPAFILGKMSPKSEPTKAWRAAYDQKLTGDEGDVLHETTKIDLNLIEN